MKKRLYRRLIHAHVNLVLVVLLFWVLQLVAWLGMMVYVQFFNRKLGGNVLYVTQISHWALVLSCGVAVTAAWGLLQSKHNAGRIDDLHEREKKGRRCRMGGCVKDAGHDGPHVWRKRA